MPFRFVKTWVPSRAHFEYTLIKSKEIVNMPGMPGFIKSGADGLDQLNASKFVKLSTGKPVEVVCLTGVEPPEGEEPNGKNAIISYQEYTKWMDDLPEGKMSPRFPAIGGAYDPGKVLGLVPRFRMLMLVMEKGSDEEKILSATVSIFKQLVEVEAAMGHSLRGSIVRITKTGEGLKTKYRVVPTGRSVEIEGIPETNLIDFIGPMTREDICEMLEGVGLWPPDGGDPATKKSSKKLPPAAKPPVEDEEEEGYEVPDED